MNTRSNFQLTSSPIFAYDEQTIESKSGGLGRPIFCRQVILRLVPVTQGFQESHNRVLFCGCQAQISKFSLVYSI